MTISVLLVDHHQIVRAGVRALLEMESDLEVVGEASDGASAIRLARKLRPDVMITDLTLPDRDGICVTQSVRAEVPDTRVVVLTTADEEDVSVVRAVRAGAVGYLTKDADTALLIGAIRAAADGQVHLSQRAAAGLMREMRSPTRQLPLTDREAEVLREMAAGRTNKEIARSLHIGETTVKSHVRAILDKLGVRCRTQAALQAYQSRALPVEPRMAA